MTRTINIIGAGIAGLAAGIYGQLNGYRTRIFEMGRKPGGLCTAWRRGDYLIDGCLHWLVGAGHRCESCRLAPMSRLPGCSLNRLWQELGVLEGRELTVHPQFLRVRDPASGRSLDLFNDLDRLERHLLELAPGDAKPIRRFTGGARKASHFRPALGRLGLRESLSCLVHAAPSYGALLRGSRTPVREFVSKLRDPFLKRAFGQVFSQPDTPLVGLQITLGWQHRGCASYPLGGSLDFARAMERRYLDLGGEVEYGSRVTRVTVSGGRATGLAVEGDGEHPGDAVISAADVHATVFDMLGGRFLDARLRRCFDEFPLFPTQVQVSLGVARDLSDQPHVVFHLPERPFEAAGTQQERLNVKTWCHEPSSAPAGKSVAAVCFRTEHGYWQALAGDREAYEAEKQALAELAIGRLAQHFEGIRDDVEVVDVATPLTYERFTGNWQGSLQGWAATRKTVMTQLQPTLPGLQGFYLAGQWLRPGGGLPVAAATAQDAIRRICKADGKKFTTPLS